MVQQIYSEEIDFVEYYRVIYKNRRLVALFLVLGIIFGYVINILPIYNYRASALVKSAMVNGGSVEPASQTIEKMTNGFYGKYSSVSGSYISQNFIQIWSDNRNAEQAKKTASEVSDKIIKEQNELVAKEKTYKLDKIESLKSIMNNYLSRGQEVALFHMEIIRIEDQVSGAKQAELLGDIKVQYRKI